MRRRGGKLLEIGLLGDRRIDERQPGRSLTGIFELMRHTFFFGRSLGVTDFLCGIPPRRAALYQRCFGFKPAGPELSYASVNSAPVVLMHARTRDLLARPWAHRAVAQFLARPLTPDAFADRYAFDPDDVAASPLRHFAEA